MTPRQKPFDPKQFAGRSLESVLNELGPRPGEGWKWISVECNGQDLAYIFEHPEHPAIQRIIGGTVDLEFYRPTCEASPFVEDRYPTLAAAIAAK